MGSTTTARSGWASPQLWWRIAIVFACVLGLMSGTHVFAYYTTQSNVIVTAYLATTVWWMLTRRTTDAPAPRLRGGVTLWIVVTGLVSHVFLQHGASPFPGLVVADPAQALANQSLFVLHYVVPAMVLLDWIAFGPRGVIRWRDGLVWLLYPVVYGVFTLARAAAFPSVADRFPYPFFDYETLGPGIVWALARVLLVIAALAAAVIGIDRLAGLASRRVRAPEAIPDAAPADA